jgi:glycosyltransferase involved in cell wall biosynthesis
VKPVSVAFIGQRGVPATFGGIEHHVEEIGSRLAARGHRVTVYTRGNYTDSRQEMYRGMRVRYTPTIATKRLEALVHSGVSTLSALTARAEPFDVLHYHAVGPAVFTPLPRVMGRWAVVCTIHGLDYDRVKWRAADRLALRAAGWITGRVPHATITVSRSLAAYYRHRYGRPADYIPNGVSRAHPRPPSLITERFGLHGGDYLLFLGRLVPEKAPDLLLEAFGRMPGTTRLVIAGGSSFTDSYVEALVRKARLDSRVLMAGPVYGALRDELYTNAAAFVLPSLLEGLPLTLLEAASHGLPIVASDIAPHREVLGEDAPGGRLFRSADVSSLCDAMCRALAEPDAERAGARTLCERVMHEYDWEKATDQVEAVYSRVLAAVRRQE